MFKFIGVLIGFFISGGFWGALLGYIIGSFIDNLRRKRYRVTYHHTTPNDFTHSLLVFIAAVVKSDNRFLKSELYFVRDFLVKNLGPIAANNALLELREILKEDYNIEDYCYLFRQRSSIHERFLIIQFLLGLAGADDYYGAEEVAMIDKIAHWFGINPIDYASLKAMYIGGYSRQSSSYSPPSTSTNLENDYKVLKIKETASDAEVKKAYRKLAQEYHPDKVNHLGEDMRKAAEDKFTKLNQAYERIKKARGFL